MSIPNTHFRHNLWGVGVMVVGKDSKTFFTVVSFYNSAKCAPLLFTTDLYTNGISSCKIKL